MFYKVFGSNNLLDIQLGRQCQCLCVKLFTLLWLVSFTTPLLLVILYRTIDCALGKTEVANELTSVITLLKQPDYSTFYGVVLLFLSHLFLLDRIFCCATFCRQ